MSVHSAVCETSRILVSIVNSPEAFLEKLFSPNFEENDSLAPQSVLSNKPKGERVRGERMSRFMHALHSRKQLFGCIRTFSPARVIIFIPCTRQPHTYHPELRQRDSQHRFHANLSSAELELSAIS
jgi:hypothetical protein